MVGLKDNFIRIVLASIGFIAMLMYFGEYDIILPIYIIFMVIFFFQVRIKNTWMFIFILLYYSIYVGYGMIFQSTVATFSAFMSSFIYIMFLFIILNGNKKLDIESKPALKVFITVIILDLILSAVLVVRNGTLQADFNNHPVGGALTVMMIPYLIAVWDTKMFTNKVFKYTVIAIMMASITLSGIRGYYLIGYISLFMLVFMDYMKIKRSIIFYRVVFTLIFIGLVGVVIFSRQLLDIVDSLGIFNTLGRRYMEFDIVGNVQEIRGLTRNIFGDGFGISAGNKYPLAALVGDTWDIATTNRSLVYHNSYLSTVYIFGYFGLLLYGGIIISLLHKIYKLDTTLTVKLALTAYVTMYCASLFFRRTAFRGIPEFILIALVINAYKPNGVVE